MILQGSFSKTYNEGVAVFVQPPSRRIVSLRMEGNRDGDCDDDELEAYKGKFFLSFPYVVFAVKYIKHPKDAGYTATGLRVAFATRKDPRHLYYPPMCNIDDNLQVCQPLSHKKYKTLEECVKVAVAGFWSSEFDDSMYDSYTEYEPTSLLGDARKWQKKTKKNPTWTPSARSLKRHADTTFADLKKAFDYEYDEDVDDDYDD